MARRRGTPTPKNLTATGDCYESAVTQILFDKGSRVVLVHGRPTLQAPPFVEYGHAWIEDGDEVIDATNGFRGPRWTYYMLGKIDYRNNLVYTPEQARAFIRYYGHYGPWEGPDGVSTRSQDAREVFPGAKKPKRTKKSKEPKTPTGGPVREDPKMRGKMGKATPAWESLSDIRGTLIAESKSKRVETSFMDAIRPEEYKPGNTPAESCVRKIRSIGYRNPFFPGFVLIDNVNVHVSTFGSSFKNYQTRVHIHALASVDKGQGNGAAVLKKLKKLADEFGVTLEGTVRPFGDPEDGRLNKKQLISWYRRAGFKVGRNGIAVYKPTK